jgi:CubicO group peptidase (beta-lactamase class C family)
MKRFLTLICVCGLVLPIKSVGQKNYALAIDKYMQAQVKVNEFSGVVLVTAKDKVIYKKAFGYADREWKIPTTLDTKFEIGSLTKQFTAAAILQLVEQKKLNLDDKLSIWFPGYPKGDSVTLHMLLNHTSGIADYTSLPSLNKLHTLPLSEDSVISLFKNQPYKFSPGTNWSYSNSNYFLLGSIIEKVTGKRYADYLTDNILKKAALTNTVVNRLDSVLAFRARGYSKEEHGGGWKNAEYFSMEFPFSAGSLISTASDLYKWQAALLSAKIISAPMLAKMTTPYLHDYGYGLSIDSFNHYLRIAHGGAIPGFTSYMSVFPAKNISIIILSNDEGNSDQIGNAIAADLFDMPVQMPYKPVEKAINVAVLKRYIGKYQLGGTTNFEIIEKDKYLFLKPGGGGAMMLKPESETKFFFAGNTEQEIEFILDKNGEITKCYFINKGTQMEIKRLTK